MRGLAKNSGSITKNILALGLLLGGAGCGADRDTDRAPETTPAGKAPASAPGPAAPVAARPAPLRVSVFLEYSGGMRGFVPAGTAATEATAFQRRVGSLLTETQVSGAVAARQYFLVYKDTDLRPTPFAKMRDVVQGLQSDAALGTELPEMLEAILSRPAAATEVSVIVSDFIYGPQDPTKIPLIADYIRTAVASVGSRGLAVAVLAERSGFVGTYHPAVKTPVARRQMKGEKVPYYVWVVGPPALVGRYLSEVATGLPAEQAYFGLRFASVPFAVVLDGLPPGSPLAPAGGASVSYAGAKASPELDIEDVRQTAEFTVALNLARLPAAWQEPGFLARQLRAELPGGAPPLLVPGSVRRLTAAEQAAAPLAAHTHVLRLRLNALPAGQSTLALRLAAPDVPAWAAEWSTTNDNRPGPLARTYRLTDILAGLRAAFPPALPPVFTVQLRLTNQD